LNINDLWQQVETISKDKWPEVLMQIFHSFQEAPDAVLEMSQQLPCREDGAIAALKMPKQFHKTQPLNSLPIQDESEFLHTNKSQTYSNYNSTLRKSDRVTVADKKDRSAVYYIH
jgi:hypothetical protein